MRATSLPTAHSVAAAALALVAAALAVLAVPSTAVAERWQRPVPGEVARPFEYDRSAPFTAGAHRGADLAAAPGAPVRAACAGRVIHAGAVAGRHHVVSTRCGARRVSYLPLTAMVVRVGENVRAGARIGSVAAGHDGLHLGVRREGDPFGYEDPMALLPAPDRPSPPMAPRVAPRPASPRVAARQASPRVAPRPVTPRVTLRPAPRRAPSSSPAPWPVWAGLGLLLSGAAGSGAIVARRRSVRRPGTTGAAAAPAG